MERIAHLGPYRDDNSLEAVRLDDGAIELIVCGERRVRLEPGDHLALAAKCDLYKTAPLAAFETKVTLVRASGEQLFLTWFEFDAMWGGHQPRNIRDELSKIGCAVELVEEIHQH